MSELDLAKAYRTARERITAVVTEAGAGRVGGLAVPATPAWSVHDVVAHLRGILEDALVGNMAGAPGEAWTAAQVERGAAKSVELLLEEWADDSAVIEGALGGPAGPQMTALIVDVHSHEQDLRGALGRPGHRSGPFYPWALPKLVAGFQARCLGAELAPVRVEADFGSVGSPDDPVAVRGTDWELFRAMLGRRSADQIVRLEWSGVPEPAVYVDAFVMFGPAAQDVVEPAT
jgi:uncharacterized protein (TIGR03083 family)